MTSDNNEKKNFFQRLFGKKNSNQTPGLPPKRKPFTTPNTKNIPTTSTPTTSTSSKKGPPKPMKSGLHSNTSSGSTLSSDSIDFSRERPTFYKIRFFFNGILGNHRFNEIKDVLKTVFQKRDLDDEYRIRYDSDWSRRNNARNFEMGGVSQIGFVFELNPENLYTDQGLLASTKILTENYTVKLVSIKYYVSPNPFDDTFIREVFATN